MFDKFTILLIILVLLLIFYFVIRLGAGKKRQSSMTKEFPSPEIASYLFGVRILIIILAVVGLILWFFI